MAFVWKNSHLHILYFTYACWVPKGFQFQFSAVADEPWGSMSAGQSALSHMFHFSGGPLEFISASGPQRGQPSLFCQVSLICSLRKQRLGSQGLAQKVSDFFCLLSILSTDELCLLELSDKKAWTDFKKMSFYTLSAQTCPVNICLITTFYLHDKEGLFQWLLSEPRSHEDVLNAACVIRHVLNWHDIYALIDKYMDNIIFSVLF